MIDLDYERAFMAEKPAVSSLARRTSMLAGLGLNAWTDIQTSQLLRACGTHLPDNIVRICDNECALEWWRDGRKLTVYSGGDAWEVVAVGRGGPFEIEEFSMATPEGIAHHLARLSESRPS